MSTPLPSQPASFFPTTALVRSCSIYFDIDLINEIGPCSGWTWSWHCHHAMYAAFGPLESKATGIDGKPYKWPRQAYMALAERNTTISRMARNVSWLNPQYCWKCFELGPLFSSVRVPCTHFFISLSKFFSYNMLKKRASGGDLTKALSAPQYLMCSAEASSHSFLIIKNKVLTSF